MKFFLLALALTSMVLADQTYYNFKTTWGPDPIFGTAFFDQPRTVKEADDAKFKKVSSCSDSDEFLGNVYVPSDSNEFAVIYDVNGFIAGMHAIVPMDVTYEDQYYKFSTSPWYRAVKNEDGAVVSYVTTAYFIEPSKICEGGRTQEEYDRQGTLGDMLLIKKGDELLKMPLTEDDAKQDAFWYKHNCFLNMGNHFFNLDPTVDADAATGCDTATPLQMVYQDNIINAFVWQHVAPIPMQGYNEEPPKLAIQAIVDNPPTCLLNQVDEPGVRTMHVYVGDYIDVCGIQ